MRSYEAQERMREEEKMRKLLESALRMMEQDERQIAGIKCCSLNSVCSRIQTSLGHCCQCPRVSRSISVTKPKEQSQFSP